MKKLIIGKKVIVRSNVAGVHFGTVEAVCFEKQTIVLKNARRLWRVYTRDKSGSISDIAANGLMDDKEHSIGALLKRVTIVNPDGLEIAEVNPKAAKTILSYETR